MRSVFFKDLNDRSQALHFKIKSLSMENNKEKPGNAEQRKQGVDKDPREEKGKKEELTTTDLKGKKVDADPEKPSDQPFDKKKDS